MWEILFLFIIIILIILFVLYLCYKLKNYIDNKCQNTSQDVFNSLTTIVKDKIGSLENVVRNSSEGIKKTVTSLDKEASGKFGEINNALKNSNDVTNSLNKAVTSLNNALGDVRIRGQWGERMAEDIIKAIGLVEGINYEKQSTATEGIRPDFTFKLTTGVNLNLDSKFPLNNYLKYHSATNDNEKKDYLKKFLKDIRDRIKEICVKEYIDPLNNTTDFALIFIPNDAVLNFVQEEDPEFIDYALSNKIVVCSPWTLYIVLSVVRHASQLYCLDKNTAKALEIINKVRKEWSNYRLEDDKVDKKLNEMNNTRNSVTGVRSRQLEKAFAEIDKLGVSFVAEEVK